MFATILFAAWGSCGDKQLSLIVFENALKKICLQLVISELFQITQDLQSYFSALEELQTHSALSNGC